MKLVLASVACALFVTTLPALADPIPTREPGVVRVPVIVVHGRSDRPYVVIEFKRPNATVEAGEAHESLRAALLAQTEPTYR